MEVQYLIEKVDGDREVQVLNWMLDGKSQRWIGQHMALSATSIKRIKDNIVKQMIASLGVIHSERRK
ncbi:LuxR C-terminal-related transcriptional regulator [Lysinibacillus sp. NPDC093210]|uniref:LuxR C-terminal-related transcriptional regulator n=1 Tax=Lysinibacillus sp. NPDC093210 TaxID=3364133 RepID=UPI00380C414B